MNAETSLFSRGHARRAPGVRAVLGDGELDTDGWQLVFLVDFGYPGRVDFGLEQCSIFLRQRIADIRK